MELSVRVKRSLFLIFLSFSVLSLYSQDQTKSSGYVPHIGQAGKDVIWVPTPNELVNKMLEVAEVTENDYVIDLGSGDGRTVIAAAKLGARALGIEYNPEMIEISKKKAEEAGVSGRTEFIEADLFTCDLSKGTVITLFLLPEINLKLRPRFLDLNPGTRIVSNTFTMGDWEPDYEVMTEENMNSWCTALMWIVPAKVEGIWNLGNGELTITQVFQMVYGTLKTENNISRITDGRLSGDNIRFNVNGINFTGKVTGKTVMSGKSTSGSGEGDWIATR